MKRREKNIDLIRGDTLPIVFSLVNKNGNRISEEVDEIYFTIKKNYNDIEYVLQKKLSTNQIKKESDVFKLIISHEETANLEYGYYIYDIEIKIDNYIKTVVIGKINLLSEVTFIENE